MKVSKEESRINQFSSSFYVLDLHPTSCLISLAANKPNNGTFLAKARTVQNLV